MNCRFKNRILFFLIILVSRPEQFFSQAPLGIPFQAVLKNLDSTFYNNSSVDVQFKIHDYTATGDVVYEEVHLCNVNLHGLVSCAVGQGVVIQGVFSEIDWSTGYKYLQVLINGVEFGTQQFSSVHRALYSETINIEASHSGDTLKIGENSLIVPGIVHFTQNSNYHSGNGVTDVDGNYYSSVVVNGQEWMRSNLKVSHYRNGDEIPQFAYNDWLNATNGSFALYNNDLSNEVLFGKLYNWYAVIDSRGLCPVGWHSPSIIEWRKLLDFLGGSEVAGGKLKSEFGWDVSNSNATNEIDFDALPGGYMTTVQSSLNIGKLGNWWCNQSIDIENAWNFALNSNSNYSYFLSESKRYGLSVRCVRD